MNNLVRRFVNKCGERIDLAKTIYTTATLSIMQM